MKKPFRAIMVKHRRMEAEFIRGLRISMFHLDEIPPTKKEMELFVQAVLLIGAIAACSIILISGCHNVAVANGG